MKLDIQLNPHQDETTITIHAKELTPDLQLLIEKIQAASSNSILGKKNQKIYPLNKTDIYYFYSEDQKILAQTVDDSYEIKEKLYILEDLLAGTSFIRISKSVIANMSHVKSLETFFNGSMIICFTNGKKESVSRNYLNGIKNYLGIGGKN